MAKKKNEIATTNAEEIVKKVHKRPKKSEQLRVNTEPGDNTKYLNHNLELMMLPKVDLCSVKEVEDRSILYFQICSKNDMKPSVASYALALGYGRTELWKIVTGQANKPSEVVNSVKRVYDALTAQMEDYMQNGKINPVSGIFLMKNNMGYTDKQEVVVSKENPLGSEQSPEEIAERYKDVIDE